MAVVILEEISEELNSGRVRFIHDGTYFVDVNQKIKVRDRMKFPLIYDAAAVMLEGKEMAEELDTEERYSVMYDMKRAHKLVPVEERNWDLQACRLPGKRKSDDLYVHTRGIFGMTSAVYY